MEALQVKLVAGTILAAGAIAFFYPVVQRQIAIYQLQSVFPGIKAPPAPNRSRPWYANVERVSTDLPGYAKVTVSVDNKSASEAINILSVQCVALDTQGNALATGTGFVTSIAPGERGYGALVIVLPAGTQHDKVKCKGEPLWG